MLGEDGGQHALTMVVSNIINCALIACGRSESVSERDYQRT